MKILFVAPRYWPAIGGAELYVRQVAHSLGKRHDVEIVTHCTTEPYRSEEAVALGPSSVYDDEGIKVHRVGVPPLLRAPLFALGSLYERTRIVRPLHRLLLRAGIAREIERIAVGFDLIHAVYNGLLASVEYALEAAGHHGAPFVFSPLPHIRPGSSGWDGPRFRRLYREADGLVAMTEFEKAWLSTKGGGPERTYVCPFWPVLAENQDVPGFLRKYGLAGKGFVLFLARQVDYKGYRQVCEAAGIVWKTYPETYFVFVGPQTEESKAYFQVLKDPRFVNLGEVTLEEKTSALAACEVLCVPSTDESLGVVYQEAWTFRKPVVAARIPVLRSVISHGEDGLLADQDAHEIAAALAGLLGDEEARRRMGEAGYRKVAAEYNEDVVIGRLLAAYDGLIARRKPGDEG